VRDKQDHQQWNSQKWQQRHDQIAGKWNLDGSTECTAPPEGTPAATGTAGTTSKPGFALCTRDEARKKAAQVIDARTEQQVFRKLKEELERDM
jgi:hypothetical protein